MTRAAPGDRIIVQAGLVGGHDGGSGVPPPVAGGRWA
jgi:hypothetical protein